MARKLNSSTVYQQGKVDLARFPIHIGLEIFRRLNQRLHEKNQPSKKQLAYTRMQAR